MSAPVEVRDQARALREQEGLSYTEIGRRVGYSPTAVQTWIDHAYAERQREADRAGAARRRAERKAEALAELIEPPLDDGSPGAFTRGYERAIAAGVDPLELRDACWECPSCRRLPVDGCVCVPVREKKAA